MVLDAGVPAAVQAGLFEGGGHERLGRKDGGDRVSPGSSPVPAVIRLGTMEAWSRRSHGQPNRDAGRLSQTRPGNVSTGSTPQVPWNADQAE